MTQLEDLVYHTNIPMVKEEHGEQQGTLGRSQCAAAQTEMERVWECECAFATAREKGRSSIEYATLEDFDRVVEVLKGSHRNAG